MLNYKGLKTVFERMNVAEEMVDRQIDRLLEQYQRTTPITDRASLPGDEVLIDYTGFCDGEIFEGGSAQDQTLVLGSGMFIPGFEAQLEGKMPGERVDVVVTFPEAYHAPQLAGKKATFRCKLKEIRVRSQYEADDAFAKDIGGFDSFDQFKAQLHAGMQAYVDQQAELELKDRLMNLILADYECEVTSEQLEKAIDIEMRELEAQLTQQHLTMDQYCQFMSKTMDELREEAIPSARRNVQRQMVIAEIARIEGIEADEQSVAEAFADLCREKNISPDELQMHFDAQLESVLVRTVIENKVFDVIKANAEITRINL